MAKTAPTRKSLRLEYGVERPHHMGGSIPQSYSRNSATATHELVNPATAPPVPYADGANGELHIAGQVATAPKRGREAK